MKAAAVAAANRRLLEDAQVEHRRARAALDQHPSGQQHGGGHEPADHDASFQPDEPAARDAEHEAGEAEHEGRSCRARHSRAPCRVWRARAGPARPRRAPASASGTLNQNTQCQEIATSAPPSTGPSTRPIAATIVFAPIASPSCSFGKASVTSAAALANRNAEPMPCRIAPHDQHGARRRRSRRRARRSANSEEAADVGALAPEQVAEAARPSARARWRRSGRRGSPTRARAGSCAASARGRAAR